MSRVPRALAARVPGALAAVAIFVALAALPAAAVAQSCPRTSLAEIEAEVMCPVCGTPLGLASEAPQAIRQRALIQRLVDRCRSKEEVKDALVAQYGRNVLAMPATSGFELSVYVVPALALLLGATGVGLAARRWRRATRAEPRHPSPPPSAERTQARERSAERLDADLRRYEL